MFCDTLCAIKEDMRIAYAVTGNWFPRTKMHLKEYHRFLVDGVSHLPIDPELLRRVHKAMQPTNIAYIGLAAGGRFDHVEAECGGFLASYFEDGLFLARRNIGTDADADIYELHNFYNEKLLVALSALFSVGLPALSVHDPKYTERPTVVVAESATDAEVTQWTDALQDRIHFLIKHKKHRVYYGDRLIVVVTREPESDLTHQLIRSIIFFREFEARLNNFLNLHREVWHSIDEIRKKDSLSLTELPRIRDRLLDFDRDLSIVVARLSQMEDFLVERQLEIDEMDRTEYLRALEAYRFGKMRVNTRYLLQLWNQLDSYIESTANIIGLMYQESLEKSLNVLQFIFLLGSVAGVLILGDLSAGETPIVDAGGQTIAVAQMTGFNWQDLFIFGGTSLFLTFAIFFGMQFFTSKLSRIATKTLVGESSPFSKQRKKRLNGSSGS